MDQSFSEIRAMKITALQKLAQKEKVKGYSRFTSSSAGTQDERREALANLVVAHLTEKKKASKAPVVNGGEVSDQEDSLSDSSVEEVKEVKKKEVKKKEKQATPFRPKVKEEEVVFETGTSAKKKMTTAPFVPRVKEEETVEMVTKKQQQVESDDDVDTALSRLSLQELIDLYDEQVGIMDRLNISRKQIVAQCDEQEELLRKIQEKTHDVLRKNRI